MYIYVCERDRKKDTQRETGWRGGGRGRNSWSELCFEKIIQSIVWSVDGEGQGCVTRAQSLVVMQTLPPQGIVLFPPPLPGRAMDSDALEPLAAHLPTCLPPAPRRDLWPAAGPRRSFSIPQGSGHLSRG